MAEANKPLSKVIEVDGESYDVYAVHADTAGNVNNAKLTIQKNGTEIAAFTANSATDVVANISVPTITNTLTSTSTTAALSAAQGKALNDSKQDKLVSGTNIKTINGNSILGNGDLTISGGGSGGVSDVASKIKVTMDDGTKDATITVKSSDPSGGNVGDIWFKY